MRLNRISIFIFLIAVELLIFTFFIPPFQKADEYGHYFRSIAIAKGTFFCYSDKGKIEKKYLRFKEYMQVENHVFKQITLFPLSLVTQFDKMFNLSEEDKRGFFEAGLCQNSAFGYIFNIFGFYLGEFFNFNLIWQFYLMRIIPSLFYIFCVFILYKFIIKKENKLFFLLFTSLPMVNHQVSAISLDSSIFIFNTFYLALFLIFFEKKEKNNNVLSLLIFVGGMISLVKPIYIPFFIFPLIIKLQRRDLLIVTIFLLANFIFIKNYEKFPLNENLFSPLVQKKIVITDPYFFIDSIINLLKNNSLTIPRFVEMFGAFGWTDSSLNYIIIIIYFIFLIIAANRAQVYLEKKQKFIILFFVFVSLILILYGTFLGATLVGNRIVLGLQGRYFLPLIPFIFLVCLNKLRLSNSLVFLLIIITLYNLFFTLRERYFSYQAIQYMGNNCEDKTKIKKVKIVKEIQLSLINYSQRKGKERIVNGFCLRLINSKDKPSNTIKLLFYDDKNKLIDRHYFRFIGKEERVIKFINKKISTASNFRLKIIPFFKGKEEVFVEIFPDSADLVYGL